MVTVFSFTLRYHNPPLFVLFPRSSWYSICWIPSGNVYLNWLWNPIDLSFLCSAPTHNAQFKPTTKITVWINCSGVLSLRSPFSHSISSSSYDRTSTYFTALPKPWSILSFIILLQVYFNLINSSCESSNSFQKMLLFSRCIWMQMTIS